MVKIFLELVKMNYGEPKIFTILLSTLIRGRKCSSLVACQLKCQWTWQSQAAWWHFTSKSFYSLLFLSYLKVISISPPFIPVFTFCFSVSDQLQLFSFGSGSISPLMQLSTTQIEAEALQLLLSMLSYSISRSWYFCHHIVCIYLFFLTGKVECLMLWQQVELWLLHLDWTAWQRFV